MKGIPAVALALSTLVVTAGMASARGIPNGSNGGRIRVADQLRYRLPIIRPACCRTLYRPIVITTPKPVPIRFLSPGTDTLRVRPAGALVLMRDPLK